MWRLIYLLILTSQLCLAEKKMTSVLNPDFDLSQLRGSIFKLQVSSQKLDYKRPWQGSSLRQSSGTGFYIGNNRILTNAHVVSNAKNIMIQRDRDDQLYHAYVEYIGHDCDLAIVVPVDTNILRGIQKLSFGELPKLNSPVATVGYPTGGEQLSVTKGVVSRVSNRFYVHSGFNSHVLIQIDSAINSGNSGGPVIQGSQVIGVAFQHLRAGENIGYVIPTPVIERFLKDTQNGSYDGHPLSGMKTLLWTTGSKAVQKYYSLKKSSGVQLAHLAWWAPGNQHLKPGDILLKVAGKTIGVDGKIDLFGERISFETIYDLKQEGETIDFEVSRNGQAKKVNFPITKAPAHPFGPYEHRRGSQYHILGGVVFTVLSLDWFATWGKNWSKSLPTFLKHLFYSSNFDQDFYGISDFVVISHILPHKVNSYYSSYESGVVKSVNDQKISSFIDFSKLLSSTREQFIKIDFWNLPLPMVFNREKVKNIEEELKKNYVLDSLVVNKKFADGAVQRSDVE